MLPVCSSFTHLLSEMGEDPSAKSPRRFAAVERDLSLLRKNAPKDERLGGQAKKPADSWRLRGEYRS